MILIITPLLIVMMSSSVDYYKNCYRGDARAPFHLIIKTQPKRLSMEVINHSVHCDCYKCREAKSYDAPVYEDAYEDNLENWDIHEWIPPHLRPDRPPLWRRVLKFINNL